jgi:hypothetical protein
MSTFDRGLDEAQKLAKEHPDKVQKGLDQGEKQVDERTGNRYDKQVEEAGDKADQYLTGGGQGNNPAQQQGKQQ